MRDPTDRVLLISDDPSVLDAAARLLRADSHEVHTAATDEQAAVLLGELDMSAIVCDHTAGQMPWTDLLAKARALQPDAAIVMLITRERIEAAAAAMNEGRIHHFVLKPFDPAALRELVRDAVTRYRDARRQAETQRLVQVQRDELRDLNRTLEERAHQRTAELRDAYEQTLAALIIALDAREKATAGHSWRVAAYTLRLAIELGVQPDRYQDMYRGSLLHDIGKIGTPDAVLLKPAPLTIEERRVMEQHVAKGAEILSHIDYLATATAIPRYHHEKYDGTGYSERLRGDQIPLEARIFAVADVYDALRSDRPYKEAMSHEEASAIILKDSGSHFDPRVVNAFARIPAAQWTQLESVALCGGGFTGILEGCRRVSQPRLSIRAA